MRSGREPAKLIFEERKTDGITVVRHNMFTSGIGYLKVLFNTNRVPMEDLPYLGLLKSVLGYVDTKNYSYSDLSSEIFLNSGGVSFSVTSYPDLTKAGSFTGVFVCSARVLYEKLDFGFEILEEIINRSVLDDEKRLNEILSEGKSKSQMKLMGSGTHGCSCESDLLLLRHVLLQRYDGRDRVLQVLRGLCEEL